MQLNFVDFVVALACSKTFFVSIINLFLCVEEEPYHDSKLFTHSLNDNKEKSRVIKITLVCVDVIYSHFRISVNCLNHLY